jgi:hypothetical protein
MNLIPACLSIGGDVKAFFIRSNVSCVEIDEVDAVEFD